ncbi:MAG: cyclic nucleotide-binding domain-containing protein, partial [Bacteroidota bacterium]
AERLDFQFTPLINSRLLEFPAGKVLMDYGTYVQMMPLLVKGSIKVSRQDDDGQELLLYFLQAGDTCSMVSVRMMDCLSIMQQVKDIEQ